MPHESHQAPFNRSPQILADRYYRGLPVMLTEKPGDDRQHRQPAELGHISDARALLFGSCALFTTTPSKAGRMYPQRGESLEGSSMVSTSILTVMDSAWGLPPFSWVSLQPPSLSAG